MQSTEKIRVFALARELDMESKALLTLCQAHGIDVKNQLSTLEPETRAVVEELVRKSKTATPAASTAPAAPAVLPEVPGRMRTLSTPRPPRIPGRTGAETAPPHEAPPAATESPAAIPAPPAPTQPAAARTQEPAAERTPAPGPAKDIGKDSGKPPAPTPPAAAPARPTEATPPAGGEPPRPPVGSGPAGAPMRNLPGARPARPDGPRRPPIRSQMPIRIAPPPSLKQQARQIEERKQPPPAGPKKIGDIPAEFNQAAPGTNVIDLILREQRQRAEAARAGAYVAPDVEEDEDDAKGKGKGKRTGGGAAATGVVGREARHKERNLRQEKRKAEEQLRGRAAVALEDESPVRKLIRKKREKQAPTQPRKGKVPVTLPITVRSLSEAVGVKTGELLFKLMNHGAAATININSVIEPVMAETVALEHGCELEVKKGLDVEEQLLTEQRQEDRPEELVPRAPIVTIMGHVDHGKTSLLDRIRRSNVVATEAGGITQVIRAWRVEHHGKPITFLDTPGHEAFTKMRARGANVTDIAVIVVAVDDGVMPQTEEAINHAKAAGVSIIVALNKIDVPNANIRKAEQQLYGLNVLPDNMGGDSPFVQTSAAKGIGIDELLDAINLVAELKELKANPHKPARGTCLEANLTEDEGVFATLLVQDGTLHRGDVILCGSAFGRIRAMYDDLGRPIEEAGPSIPCRITGLDEVPNADDPYLVVPDLATARDIADRRKDRQLEAAITKRAPVTLESLSEAKITELKVILKADFRGSIEAIRKELEKLHHEEVRVRLLHTGIGGITESDVQLALASPEDTLILGFNTVPDDRARALAEERGVNIRQYNIIYKLTEDLRAALEGKLKPREEVIHLGRAVVRQVFKISRVGAVAGCYVTQGVIERSAKVRIIRNGVVVYPPPDRTVGLDSLKRHKDDAREVREGYDCGIKISGYDDIKVDDVIEAYRVEHVMRTLDA